MKSEHFFVTGIVAQRDKKPYIQLATEHGMVAQFTMSEARQIAMDMLVQASRTEMDAMFCAFMIDKLEAPEQAVNEAMMLFRDYRASLDDETVEHDHRIPPKNEESDG
jgi:uncharacterized protein (DUF1778 family)